MGSRFGEEGRRLSYGSCLKMVERQIGGQTGTAGSPGAEYLRTTLGKRFYPELWDVRSKL